MKRKISDESDDEILHAEIKKPLERCSVLTNITDEKIQDDVFRHLYLVLKPNEAEVNEATRATLRLIENEVPHFEDDGGCSEETSTIGYVFKKKELRKHGDDSEFHVRSTINKVFPNQRSRPVSPNIEHVDKLENPNDKDCLLKPLHLTYPLKVNVMCSASEVTELCRKMETKEYAENLIYDDNNNQLLQPSLPVEKIEELRLKVPLIYVKSRSEAENGALRLKCLDSPLVLIRGLVETLEIQMKKFTSKEMKETAPNYKLELREQWLLTKKAKTDSSWYYPSFGKTTRISNYTDYQAKMFADTISDAHKILETRRKRREKMSSDELNEKKKRISNTKRSGKIFFGTNLDFSERIFNEQVSELQKLPSFLRVHDKNNFLSHLGYTCNGVNSAQAYLKIWGCSTPAHLENMKFCSVNLNIGQGDCEWFGVPYEYYPQIDKMCTEQNLNFLSSAYWPSYDALIAAKIPVYRFTQRRGDVVFVNGGTIHWVEASGWTNNVAWNVGPASVEQLKLNIMSVELNLTRKFVSLIPIQYMTWRLAQNFRTNDLELYKMIRGILIRSLAYTTMVRNVVKKRGLRIEMIADKTDLRTANCECCTAEIFNCIFVVSRSLTQSYDAYCYNCVEEKRDRKVEVWQVHEIDFLKKVLDNFKPQDF